MKKKAIVAGHICLDITPKFPGEKQSDLSQLLRPGKLVQMKEADIHTGGAVANTGLAMKLLGADVSLMGKIGTDAFGNIVCNILEKYGVAGGMIRMDQEFTSYSVVLAAPGIDRIFLHNSGANDTFCANDISEDALQEAALFHFGYPPLMQCIYANDGAELVKLFQKVKYAGCATSLDMAFPDADSEAGRVDWKKILGKVLPVTDFFFPSVEELCYMLDRPRFMQWQKRAAGRDITEILDVDKDVTPLADVCMAYGAKVLVIKCGASGMYYRTADESMLSGIGKRAELDVAAWKAKDGFEKSYVPERILSGTGAGDTSIAAFLTAMLEGESVEQCMHMAAAAGASCVSGYDALSGLKTYDKLKQKIAAGWQKISCIMAQLQCPESDIAVPSDL
ncbi:MAG: carbohydrate kinase family protein [Acetatifactor sp.]|nr:carbohydrate kinase family protein [Acetatifactor sp.]